jgi:hypothetical protein
MDSITHRLSGGDCAAAAAMALPLAMAAVYVALEKLMPVKKGK